MVVFDLPGTCCIKLSKLHCNSDFCSKAGNCGIGSKPGVTCLVTMTSAANQVNLPGDKQTRCNLSGDCDFCSKPGVCNPSGSNGFCSEQCVTCLAVMIFVAEQVCHA